MGRKNDRMKGQYRSETIYDNGKPVHRVCVFCGELKPISEFAKNGVNPDGTEARRLDCKRCYNIRRDENKHKKRHSDFVGGQKRRGEDSPELTHHEWKQIVIFFGGECAYCGSTPTPKKRLTRDHLLAIAKGGRTEAGNIVPACTCCNTSKGSEDFRQWYRKQTFFNQARLNKILQWLSICHTCR